MLRQRLLLSHKTRPCQRNILRVEFNADKGKAESFGGNAFAARTRGGRLQCGQVFGNIALANAWLNDVRDDVCGRKKKRTEFRLFLAGVSGDVFLFTELYEFVP